MGLRLKLFYVWWRLVWLRVIIVARRSHQSVTFDVSLQVELSLLNVKCV